MWNKFLKPAVSVAAPFIGMAVGAETKNPKVAQATTNILKSIFGGKNFIAHRPSRQRSSFEGYVEIISSVVC